MSFLFLLLFFLSISAEDVVAVASTEKSDKQIYLRSIFGGVIGRYSDRLFSGLSLSMVPWKSLEITVGVGGKINAGKSSGVLFFSRIGWSFEGDFRKKDSGVILRVPIAFGWRYISNGVDYDSERSDTRTHSLNLSLGVELVVMFNRVFGISFNVNIAADVVVAYRYHSEMYNEWSDVPSKRVFPYFDGGLINFVWRF